MFSKLFANKRNILIASILTLLSLILIFTVIVKNNNNSVTVSANQNITAYKVSINNIDIGFVKNKDIINNLVNKIKEEIEQIDNTEIYIDNNKFSFTEVAINNNEITPLDLLKKRIIDNLKYEVESYCISINGEKIVYLSTKDEAKKILDDIKSMYIPDISSDKIVLNSVEIIEDVKIIPVKISPDKILSYEDTIKYLLNGTTEEKIYEVKKGDNLWTIAKNYKMSVNDIVKANPGINPELIHIGDKINLIVPKPFLTVIVDYTKTYEKNIPYKVVVKKDSSIYRNIYLVKKSGKLGKKEITAKIITVNGQIDSKEIISEKVLEEPEVKIIVQGTKRLPEDNLLVAFLPEGKGIVTSRFGMRWGRHHDGIDAGVPVGTPVYAIMPGVVTYSGWKSGYGKIVIIDHENGYETYYAHNSKLLVKKGDRVARRQKIALSGNTGRSTGPHVHFEIHKDGKLLDPLKYLKGYYGK
ncbi:peptidoglycan DD-metalloendopeptidase family protein [Caloranaerobacter ferrireducens]|uniref:peptidoglycan DD-metalloendopeptidase family protein n=1 Tax=Caloranaerobacter ferrireducens TaxID=1323370 RepID=UPI000AD5ED3F|nr:peptidoglycan DD-metalloendopeptidase family protein [Caloranaerobacter ferrireducens]